MLTKLTVDFDVSEGAGASIHWGSLLHGVLMRNLPEEIAKQLHGQATRPFSQYVEPLDDKSLKWRIGIWDESIARIITQTIKGLKNVVLSGNNVVLSVRGSNSESISKDDFISNILTVNKIPGYYELRYKTPSTHKSAGIYVAFPNMELIYQNLSSRFFAYIHALNINNDEAVMQLAGHSRIIRHELKSQPYFMAGATILGYMGYIKVKIHGADIIARLGGLLLSLAEYMGIGIKTAMGMGGCQILAVPENPDPKRKG